MAATADRVSVGPLQQDDLDAADRVLRLAFGTAFHLPDPLAFMGDADVVRTRWSTDSGASFAAHVDGELAGSSFAADWGSVGVFGPVSVRPDFWNRGIAQRLMEPAMDLFDRREAHHIGLSTFPDSPKHHALYQKYGFWPRFLTPVLSREVHNGGAAARWMGYSSATEAEQTGYLTACSELTDSIFPGLTLMREIRAVEEQGLGETVLLDGEDRLEGFAVCHCGGGSEAGSGVCYVKFGAVRPGPLAGRSFVRLLDACNAMAAARGLGRVVAGVNTGRRAAYRAVLEQGFRVDFVSVAMAKPDEVGYNRADVYVIDDWR